MSDTTKTIDLDAVAAGAKLAADVLDAHGVLLIPAGTVLTDAAIDGLRRRGVASVAVQGDAVVPTEDPALRRDRVVARLDYIFRAAGENEAMRELQGQVTAYRLGREA